MQRLGYCLIEKIRNVSYKDWQRFFFLELNISSVSHLTNFTQRKRKMYDANDLLALSLVSIIDYIYSLGKQNYCKYSKTTA